MALARWSLFGSGDQLEFWEIITRFAQPASIASVYDMEEIQSDMGRVSNMTAVGSAQSHKLKTGEN